MTENEMLKQLQRWGLAKVCAKEVVRESAPNPRQHIIERTRRFAPGTRQRAAKLLVKRDGASRRRIMAKAAGVKGMGATPVWSCDPIKGTQTRNGQHARRHFDDDSKIEMPAELQWVDKALAALAQKSAILELVVRAEFTFDGTQQERALKAQRAYGGALSYWQYRKKLDHALALLEGFRMAA